MDAKKEYDRWMSYPALDTTLRRELETAKDIDDRFYRNLEFGTGGLRGIIGAGTNRMNIYTVGKATRGFAAYLKEHHSTPSCAIGYDSRNHSVEFARITASIMANSGVNAYIYPQLMPTPMLSYAVRHLHCSGGVVITASHNPAKYNGYKAYGSDGCQLTLEAANIVLARIETEPDLVPQLPDFEKLMQEGKIHWIEQSLIDSYYDAVAAACPDNPTVPLHIVYSPLNGTGNIPVRHMLKRIGNIQVDVVPEQEHPDGNFPTCPFPNPEIKEAMQLASDLAAKVHADFFLATDPDCDRVGAGVIGKDGNVELISGNEMGVMLLDYICKMRIKSGTMPKRPVAVKTIVTTEMTSAVAKKYGVELRNVLTGFKFIGEQIKLLEADGETDRYLFGFEESYGYLSYTFVRDKDAVDAAVLICQMAAHYKEEGKNLLMVRAEMEKEYGCFRNRLLTFSFEGEQGMRCMEAVMTDLRKYPQSLTGNAKSVVITDFENDDTGLPKSNVLRYSIGEEHTIIVRPSGTEPKLKLYLTASAREEENALSALTKMENTCNEFISQYKQ